MDGKGPLSPETSCSHPSSFPTWYLLSASPLPIPSTSPTSSQALPCSQTTPSHAYVPSFLYAHHFFVHTNDMLSAFHTKSSFRLT